MNPLISLCMIVKNEENTISNCLKSAASQVDEIIIVDTGSTDNTRKIATYFGAKVVEYTWQEHFSHARNFGIEHCNGSHILVLDADEIIGKNAQSKLITFMQQYSNQCGSLKINSPYISDGKTLTKSAEVRRFFPNHSNFRFKGRIHEQLCFRGEPAVFRPTGVLIEHSGYDIRSEVAEQKFERNLNLLEKAIDESPRDSYLIFQLGRAYLGAKKYEKAIEWLQKALTLTPENYRHFASAVVDYGYALKGARRYKEASDHCLLFIEKLPDHPDLYLLLAFILMEEGNPAQMETMLACFEKCLSMKGTSIPYETVEGSTTFIPYYHIGLFFELMRDFSTAISYYIKAAEFSFDPAIDALKRISHNN